MLRLKVGSVLGFVVGVASSIRVRFGVWEGFVEKHVAMKRNLIDLSISEYQTCSEEIFGLP